MKNFCIYITIFLHSLFVPLASFSQPEINQYEGIWRSAEYGETLEFKGDSVLIYQENNGELLRRQYTKGTRRGNTLITVSDDVPFGGTTKYQLPLANDILMLLEDHSEIVYYYHRMHEKPRIIPQTDNPRTNLEYFWNMHFERYPYFEERNIDWNLAREKLQSFNPSRVDEDSLFERLKLLVDFFKNDGHVWIARKSGDGFDYYTPVHKNPVQSIKPRRDLQFLVGEKYLDKHQYNTTANGKIIYKFLPDSVGYIFIASFFGMSKETSKTAQLADVRACLDSLYLYFKSAKSLIVDVRYNGGGNDWAALTCAGLFLSEGHAVVSTRSRIQATNDYGLPRVLRVAALPNNLAGIPTVVLSSRFSASATETFLIAMKNASTAISMGEASRGMLSDSYVFELPNGWFMGVYSDKVYSFDGAIYESRGVPVDLKIAMELSDFEKGIDTVLEKAISYAKENRLRQ